MKIIVNQETCIGCGRCTEICPKAFKLDTETMKAEVLETDDLKCADKAANQCPTDAIIVQNN